MLVPSRTYGKPKNVKKKRKNRSVGLPVTSYSTDQSQPSIFNADESLIDEYWRDPFDCIVGDKNDLRKKMLLKRVVHAEYNRDSSFECSMIGTSAGWTPRMKGNVGCTVSTPLDCREQSRMPDCRDSPIGLERRVLEFFPVRKRKNRLRYTPESSLCTDSSFSENRSVLKNKNHCGFDASKLCKSIVEEPIRTKRQRKENISGTSGTCPQVRNCFVQLQKSLPNCEDICSNDTLDSSQLRQVITVSDESLMGPVACTALDEVSQRLQGFEEEKSLDMNSARTIEVLEVSSGLDYVTNTSKCLERSSKSTNDRISDDKNIPMSRRSRRNPKRSSRQASSASKTKENKTTKCPSESTATITPERNETASRLSGESTDKVIPLGLESRNESIEASQLMMPCYVLLQRSQFNQKNDHRKRRHQRIEKANSAPSLDRGPETVKKRIGGGNVLNKTFDENKRETRLLRSCPQASGKSLPSTNSGSDPVIVGKSPDAATKVSASTTRSLRSRRELCGKGRSLKSTNSQSNTANVEAILVPGVEMNTKTVESLRRSADKEKSSLSRSSSDFVEKLSSQAIDAKEITSRPLRSRRGLCGKGRSLQSTNSQSNAANVEEILEPGVELNTKTTESLRRGADKGISSDFVGELSSQAIDAKQITSRPLRSRRELRGKGKSLKSTNSQSSTANVEEMLVPGVEMSTKTVESLRKGADKEKSPLSGINSNFVEELSTQAIDAKQITSRPRRKGSGQEKLTTNSERSNENVQNLLGQPKEMEGKELVRSHREGVDLEKSLELISRLGSSFEIAGDLLDAGLEMKQKATTRTLPSRRGGVKSSELIDSRSSVPIFDGRTRGQCLTRSSERKTIPERKQVTTGEQNVNRSSRKEIVEADIVDEILVDDPNSRVTRRSKPLRTNSRKTPLRSNSQTTPVRSNSRTTALRLNSRKTPLRSNSRTTPLRSNSQTTPLRSNSRNANNSGRSKQNYDSNAIISGDKSLPYAPTSAGPNNKRVPETKDSPIPTKRSLRNLRARNKAEKLPTPRSSRKTRRNLRQKQSELENCEAEVNPTVEKVVVLEKTIENAATSGGTVDKTNEPKTRECFVKLKCTKMNDIGRHKPSATNLAPAAESSAPLRVRNHVQTPLKKRPPMIASSKIKRRNYSPQIPRPTRTTRLNARTRLADQNVVARVRKEAVQQPTNEEADGTSIIAENRGILNNMRVGLREPLREVEAGIYANKPNCDLENSTTNVEPELENDLDSRRNSDKCNEVSLDLYSRVNPDKSNKVLLDLDSRVNPDKSNEVLDLDSRVNRNKSNEVPLDLDSRKSPDKSNKISTTPADRTGQISNEVTIISPIRYDNNTSCSILANSISEQSSNFQSNNSSKETTLKTTRTSLNDSIDRDCFITAITQNAKLLNLTSFRNKSRQANLSNSLYNSKNHSFNNGSASTTSLSLLGKTVHEDSEYTMIDESLNGQSAVNICLAPGKWRKSLNRWRRSVSNNLDKTTALNSSGINKTSQQQDHQPNTNSSFMLVSQQSKENCSNVLQDSYNTANTSIVIGRNSHSRVKSKNGSFVPTLSSVILESSLVGDDQQEDSDLLLLEPTDDGTPNLPSLSLLESAIGRNLQSSLSAFHQQQKSVVVCVDPPEKSTARSRRTSSSSNNNKTFNFNETSSNEPRHPYQHQLSVPLFRQPSIPRRRRTSVIAARCEELLEHPVGIQLIPDFVYIPYEKSIRTKLSPREILLRRCNQSEPLDFSTVYSDIVLKQCRKIGEGVYGEVYMNKTARGEAVVLKIIPIEGPIEINGEAQKNYDQILPEIVIAMELSRLRNDKKFMTSGFVEINKVCCVQGPYPEHLIERWELYRDNSGSENDHPEIFPDDQLYIVFEQTYGGQDLEAFTFQNALQSYSAFVQTALTLAIAEQKFQFEHRDLHWGNILLAPIDDEEIVFCVNGEEIKVASHGVKVTIIDFTLSRMVYDDCCLYNDLANDNELFSASGDYQFDIYRFMKQRLNNQWTEFEPYTNILWLHYTIDKMISGARYRCSKSKKHRSAINVLMQLRDELLDFKSASDYVECLK